MSGDFIPKGMKLNLGCGPVQPEGWVHVDGSNRAWLASRCNWFDRSLVRCGVIPPTEFGPHVQYVDLLKPLPYEDGSIACIYAGELWEHFEFDDADRLNAECYRVLAPGGVLRVTVPDGREFWSNYINKLDEQLARPPEDRDVKPIHQHVAMFFGDICTQKVRLGFMGHFHKWQFDEVQLIEMFRRHGFVDIAKRKFHDSRIPDIVQVERSDFLIVEGVKCA